MKSKLRIDFVSDVSCPWCVIGLRGLEEALERLDTVIEADIRFQPFELNPDMPAGGENLGEHVARKMGTTPEQSARARQAIVDRAADVGFIIRYSEDSRIYNTRDAHRLLHWAGAQGRQHALKHALFEAYFTDGAAMDEIDILVRAADRAGLDPAQARAVLASGLYAAEVQTDEQLWYSRGVSSVPAIIINDQYLISGGQPADMFERALLSIAAEQAEAG